MESWRILLATSNFFAWYCHSCTFSYITCNEWRFWLMSCQKPYKVFRHSQILGKLRPWNNQRLSFWHAVNKTWLIHFTQWLTPSWDSQCKVCVCTQYNAYPYGIKIWVMQLPTIEIVSWGEKITVCTNTNFTLNPSPILWIMFQVVLNGEQYLYSQYRCMMEGEEREKLCDQVRFPSSGLCTHHSYIIQEEDTCIHRQVHNGRGKRGDLFAQIEFFHSCTICDITVTSFRRRIIAFTR